MCGVAVAVEEEQNRIKIEAERMEEALKKREAEDRERVEEFYAKLISSTRFRKFLFHRICAGGCTSSLGQIKWPNKVAMISIATVADPNSGVLVGSRSVF